MCIMLGNSDKKMMKLKQKEAVLETTVTNRNGLLIILQDFHSDKVLHTSFERIQMHCNNMFKSIFHCKSDSLEEKYRKFPKYSDTQNIRCNHSKS